jgi:hypothetical protein
MNFFIDTEFSELGPGYPIELISIGIVSEDGKEYYAESADVDKDTPVNSWVRENVMPLLTGPRLPKAQIKNDILKFIYDHSRYPNIIRPQFWGYFSDYDWVVFCQLFGSMVELPWEFPQYCLDLKQWMYHLGVVKTQLPLQSSTEHNALYDARWNLQVFNYLKSIKGI